MKKVKRLFLNIALLIVAIAVSCLIAEFFFRLMLFSDSNKFNNLKNAEFYTNSGYEESFNKLRIIWSWNNSRFYILKQHPTLGWAGSFDFNSLRHDDSDKIKKRRPVLLYGDSFADCNDGISCFEDYLNADSSFNKNYYFVNYGVKGYGVDQIYYLMDQTIDLYENPIVIFSLLTFDMQRCYFKIKDGLKPYFSIESDSIVYHNEHLTKHIDDYINENPPDVSSYLWRKIIMDDRLYSIFPFFENYKDKIEVEKVSYIKKLNRMILRKATRRMNEKKINFFFVVFCAHSEYLDAENRTWQETLAKQIFTEEKSSFIIVRDCIAPYALKQPQDDLRFFIFGDGHPTALQNKIVSDTMKNFILAKFDTINNQPL